MRPAVFLDRDGVINEEVSYIKCIEELHLFSYVKDCVLSLHAFGYYAIVISNQSGVARGYLTEETLAKINNYVVAETGVDAIYYCPYYKDGVVEQYKKYSDWRKPEIGMIHQACRDFDIDLKASMMVGDRAVDIMTGKNAGILTILLESGYGTTRLEEDVTPDYVMNDLRDVVEMLKRGRDVEGAR